MEFHTTFSFVVIALVGCVFTLPPNPGQKKAAINVEPTTISSKDKSARIIQYSNEFNPNDNSYVFQYETDNGIKVQGFAKDNQVSMQGSYFLTLPDGSQVPVQYIADEGGFRVESAAIPTPNPQIAKIAAYLKTLPPLKEPEETSERAAASKGIDV